MSKFYIFCPLVRGLACILFQSKHLIFLPSLLEMTEFSKETFLPWVMNGKVIVDTNSDRQINFYILWHPVEQIFGSYDLLFWTKNFWHCFLTCYPWYKAGHIDIGDIILNIRARPLWHYIWHFERSIPFTSLLGDWL